MSETMTGFPCLIILAAALDSYAIQSTQSYNCIHYPVDLNDG